METAVREDGCSGDEESRELWQESLPLPDALAEHRAELQQLLEAWATRQEHLLARYVGNARPATPSVSSGDGQRAARSGVSEDAGSFGVLPSGNSQPSVTNVPSSKSVGAASPVRFAQKEELAPNGRGATADCLEFPPEYPPDNSKGTDSKPSFRTASSHLSIVFNNSPFTKEKVQTQARALGFQRSDDKTPKHSIRRSGKQRLETVHRGVHEAVESVVENRCPLVRKLEAMERSTIFHVVCSVVILFNAVFLAVSADLRIKALGDFDNGSSDDTSDSIFSIVEFSLCIFYSLELLVRLIVHRVGFFVSKDYMWNLFDMLLVVTAIQEQAVELSSGGESSQANMSYLRVVRLLKMLKLLRVIRLTRVFRELRLVLDSIMGSVKSMIWSIILVIIISFMFGVCFTQATYEHLSSVQHVIMNDTCTSDCLTGFFALGSCHTGPPYKMTDGCDGCSTEVYDFCDGEMSKSVLLQHFGGVVTSMLSVFMATTGGIDWREQADPLNNHVGAIYYTIFCFYIAFFIFVVMNSLTSIFVDSVREYSARDQAQQIADQLRRKKEYMEKIVRLYESMRAIDGGKDEAVSYETFCKHSDDPQMNQFAASLDIEVTELQQFFGILSDRGKRAVDIETFVVGCIKLRGSAKSMDVNDLLNMQRITANEARTLARDQRKFMTFCEEQFARVLLETPRRHFARTASFASTRGATTSLAMSGSAFFGSAEVMHPDRSPGPPAPQGGLPAVSEDGEVRVAAEKEMESANTVRNHMASSMPTFQV